MTYKLEIQQLTKVFQGNAGSVNLDTLIQAERFFEKLK
jgi:hypothetical protein